MNFLRFRIKFLLFRLLNFTVRYEKLVLLAGQFGRRTGDELGKSTMELKMDYLNIEMT